MTPIYECQKKIREMNQTIAKISSLKTALEKARTLGAFHMQGVVFYHNKLCHISELKRTKDNHK